MTKVGVLGARGRMGREVVRTVTEAPDLEVAAEVDQGDPLDGLAGCDVVVDFTHPGAVMANLHWCVDHGLDVVIGTSGFAEDRLDEVRGWLPERPDVRGQQRVGGAQRERVVGAERLGQRGEGEDARSGAPPPPQPLAPLPPSPHLVGHSGKEGLDLRAVVAAEGGGEALGLDQFWCQRRVRSHAS